MMTKYLSLLFVVLIAFSFSACENKRSKHKTTTETMILNEQYSLNVGDEIKKLSSDAKLRISQNSESDTATYELTQGEAVIIRK